MSELIKVEAAAYLKKAKLIVAIPEKWSREASARTADGEAVDFTDPDAKQFDLATAFSFGCGVLPGDSTDDEAAFLARDTLCDTIKSYFYSIGEHQSFVERYQKGSLMSLFNNHDKVEHGDVLMIIDRAIATLNQDNAGLWS